MNVFALMATLTLNKADYDKGLEDAEHKADGFGSKLAQGLGTAGKIAGGALLAVGTASVGAASAMFKGAQDAAAYGDNIDKMSQKMGLSAEAYQEWDFVMQHAGTSMETLKASMKTLSTAAVSNKDAFDKLGISQEALAQMSQEDLFSATIEALQGVTDETERTYLTGQLLGRGATELGALLNMSADEVADMRQQVHDLGGVMSNEAVKASAEYADNVQNLQTAVSGMGRSLTSTLLPGLSQAAAGLAGMFSGSSGATQQFQQGLNGMLKSITDTLPKFVKTAGTILSSVIGAISESLPELFESGVVIIEALITAIIDNLPLLAESALGVISSLALYLGESMPELIPSVVEMVLTLVQGLLDNVPMLIDAALALITGLAQGLVNAIPVLLARLPEIITALLNGLLGAIPQIIQAGITLLTALVGALPEIIKQIVAVLPQIINGIVGAVMNNLPLIIQAGVDLFVALVTDLPTIIFEIVKAIPKIIGAIVKEIGGLAWKLVQAGAELGLNLLKGIWEGIKNAASWLWNKVTGWFDSFWGGVKGLFGVHSPSTLFRDQIGKNLMLGFADGIARYGYYGVNAMDDWSRRINDAVSIDPINDVTADSMGGYELLSTTQRGGNVYNIYAQKMTPAEIFEEAARVEADRRFLGIGGADVLYTT